MVRVFLDVSDLYYRAKKQFDKKLNYQALLNLIKVRFGEIEEAEAFGCQTGNEAQSFISYLRACGIIVKYRRPKVFKIKDQDVKSCNWNVEITISALCSESKTLIFCTSSMDLIPLYQHLQNMGYHVIVMGCGIPESVRSVVDTCVPLDSKVMN